MRKILFICFIVFFGIQSYGYAQTNEIKTKLATISNKWELKNGNVLIRQNVKMTHLFKNNVFDILKECFLYKFPYFNIQEIDKANGIIVAKGLIDNIYNTDISPESTVKHSFPFIIKTTCADSNFLIEVTLTSWTYYLPLEIINGNVIEPEIYTKPISSMYPINTSQRDRADSNFKTVEGLTFYKGVIQVLTTIDSIENAVITGKIEE
jgi:hypothetical protein